jgi:hypothetical protein
MGRHRIGVDSGQLVLDRVPFLVIGLRCSNALVSDRAVDQLIQNLPVFAGYGVNTITVYLMGSRYGDVAGYDQDGTLNPAYTSRLSRLLAATDDHGMAVLVGCLYWGGSRSKHESWTQAEAERAVRNTMLWLVEQDARHVFVDVDNEGMAQRKQGFDDRALVIAAKSVAPTFVVGTNFRGPPPVEADIALHFAHDVADKPYVETEGSPDNAPGGYWGAYSKMSGLYGYRNVGGYTAAMKRNQIDRTVEHLSTGRGYVLASTWLQAPPPQGPNHVPGGRGGPGDPGIRWWLEFIRARYGDGAVADVSIIEQANSL